MRLSEDLFAPYFGRILTPNFAKVVVDENVVYVNYVVEHSYFRVSNSHLNNNPVQTIYTLAKLLAKKLKLEVSQASCTEYFCHQPGLTYQDPTTKEKLKKVIVVSTDNPSIHFSEGVNSLILNEFRPVDIHSFVSHLSRTYACHDNSGHYGYNNIKAYLDYLEEWLKNFTSVTGGIYVNEPLIYEIPDSYIHYIKEPNFILKTMLNTYLWFDIEKLPLNTQHPALQQLFVEENAASDKAKG